MVQRRARLGKTKVAAPITLSIASMTKPLPPFGAAQELGNSISILPFRPTHLNSMIYRSAASRQTIPRSLRKPAVRQPRELMTHTAGYVRILNADSLKAAQLGVSPSLLNGGKFGCPTHFQPVRPGVASIPTGWCLGRASVRQRLANYFDEHIFKPLGIPTPFMSCLQTSSIVP